MARPPRRPPAQEPAAARSGGAARGLEELAALRGKLGNSARGGAKPARDAGRAAPPADRRKAARDPGDAEPDDATLFQSAVRDVAPLAHPNTRAEIETPKPPPVPRPRQSEAEEEPAGHPSARERSEPLEGSALFRAAMGEVTPLKFDERADPGSSRPRAGHPRHGAPHDVAGPAKPPPVLLPPDADAAEPGELFRFAARGVQPIDQKNRVALERPPPPPEPIKRSEDEQAALHESLAAPLTLEDRLEMGDEAVFLRPGVPRRVLADLRRGRWVLQAELDLHGHTREVARAALAEFLAASLHRGHRFVRIIHGKGHGSPGKFSILKQLSRGWLAQREEILAFCQAGPYEGGSGALLVLLKGRTPPRDADGAGR